MKKIISALKSTALVAFISLSQASGQDLAASSGKFPNVNNSPDSEATRPSAAIANVSKRAIKDFAKTYESNVQPLWSITENGGFTASFAQAGLQNCVYYDKKGNWTCNIKRYDESKMSREIRSIIKPVYYDHTINGIAEITVPGNIVHLVYLQENATNFKTIRVCNGEMDVLEWIKDGKIMQP